MSLDVQFSQNYLTKKSAIGTITSKKQRLALLSTLMSIWFTKGNVDYCGFDIEESLA